MNSNDYAANVANALRGVNIKKNILCTCVFVCSTVLCTQYCVAGEVPLEKAAGGVTANVHHGGADCG